MGVGGREAYRIHYSISVYLTVLPAPCQATGHLSVERRWDLVPSRWATALGMALGVAMVSHMVNNSNTTQPSVKAARTCVASRATPAVATRASRHART